MPLKKEKKPQLKGDEAEKVILDYLKQQYRPYSVNDIIQNLHGTIAKAAAVKALENLTAEKKIVTKVLGKMSISVANKVEIEEPDENADYGGDLSDLKAEIQETNEQLFELQSELASVTKYPNDKDLEVEYSNLEAIIQELQSKIEVASATPSIGTESINKIKAFSTAITTESQKRLKLYKNFIKYLSEFMDPKKLISDVGLEEINMV